MIDLYTKSVLTAIALFLAVIVIRGVAPITPALAQNGPVRVVISSVDNFAFQFATVPVRVVQ